MGRIATVSFLLAFCIAMAAQTKPTLVAVNMPTYPPLARQARIAGVVKLTFVLSGNANEPDEPTNVEVISGHPMLKDAAIENVKTWKFTVAALQKTRFLDHTPRFERESLSIIAEA